MSLIMKAGYVLLEDGTRFDGELITTGDSAVGETVFTTSMAGYQEALTDPSFAAQIITFTYPHIGNYGVDLSAMESDRVQARGVIVRAASNYLDSDDAQGFVDWLEAKKVSAISDVDTRALVRHLRDRGAMRGGIFSAAVDESTALARLQAEPAMSGRNLAAEMSSQTSRTFGASNASIRIAALDTGIKRSIIEEITKRGAQLEIFPYNTGAGDLLAQQPDAIFLGPGPGDPAALGDLVATVRDLIGKRPLFGICLGHQVLAQAIGLETFKLQFGHRGANHPVKDVRSNEITITSQNHGFAVRAPHNQKAWESDFGRAEVTHVSLYDGTVEGISLPQRNARSVQYHPEAAPGPNDSLSIFDEFIAWVKEVNPCLAATI